MRDGFREWLSDNLRYILLILAVAIGVWLISLAVKFAGRVTSGDKKSGSGGPAVTARAGEEQSDHVEEPDGSDHLTERNDSTVTEPAQETDAIVIPDPVPETEAEKNAGAVSPVSEKPEKETEIKSEKETEIQSETEPGTEAETVRASRKADSVGAGTKAETEPEELTEAQRKAGIQPEVETETEIETETETETEAETETKTETETETETEAETETKTETEAETETKPRTLFVPKRVEQTETEAETETETEAKTRPSATGNAKPETEVKKRPDTEAETETETETESETEIESDTRTVTVPKKAEQIRPETEAETETETETEAETAPETEFRLKKPGQVKSEIETETETETGTKAKAETETETKTGTKAKAETETETETDRKEPETEFEILVRGKRPEREPATETLTEKETEEIDTLVRTTPQKKYAQTSANIRTGPGTENELLGTVDYGRELTVTGETTDWYRVTYNGQTGFVSKELLGDTYTPDYRVMNGTCYLRSEACYGDNIIGEIYGGTEVEFVFNDGGWAYIRVDGQEGYIGARFLPGTGY